MKRMASSELNTPPDELEPSPAASSAPAIKAPSLLKAAGLIALVTIFSKVLGFARDWAVMYVYGTSLVSDAYYAAFQLPSFAIVLLGGLGGPFHTTTVSVFSRLIHDNGPPSPRAKAMVGTFITLTSVAFTLFSILILVAAYPIMALIYMGQNLS